MILPRNLERRVEILFPILNPELKDAVWHVLVPTMERTLMLSSVPSTPVLRQQIPLTISSIDGNYEKVDRHGKDLYNAQEEFCKEYTVLAAKEHKLEKQARVFQPEYKN